MLARRVGHRPLAWPWKMRASTLLSTVLLLFVSGIVIYPLVMIFYGSFWSGPPGSEGYFTIQGYLEAYSDPKIISALGNTFSLAIIRTLLSTALAIVLAWLLVRTDLPYKGALEILLWLYFFLPAMPMAMAWILLLSPDYGLINKFFMQLPFIGGPIFNIFSFWGIVWVHIPIGAAIRVLMLTPAFRAMDASLEESSRMSGASNVATLFRITVPLLMPAILGATLLGFIKSLESFEVELLLGTPVGFYVYTTKIYDLIHFTPAIYPPAMALTTIFMAVVFALIYVNMRVLGRRQFVTVTGRGFLARVVSLGRWRLPLLGLVIFYIVIGTFMPLIVLGLGSFTKYFGYFASDPWTLHQWAEVLKNPLLLGAIRNSIYLGLGVALGGLVLYTFVSYVVIRTKYRARGALDFVSWLPWSVPGLVLALGILWAFVGGLRLPFVLYGTLWLMMLAIVVKEMPVGLRIMNASMMQLGKELEESAWVHGGSWLYTFRRIVAPLLKPAFLSVFIIIFLGAIRDLVTVVLLYTPKSRVLSTVMLDYWSAGLGAKAVVVGLMLTLIVVIAAVSARFFGLGREQVAS